MCISEILVKVSTAVTALREILYEVGILWHEVKLQAMTSCQERRRHYALLIMPSSKFMSRLIFQAFPCVIAAGGQETG